MPKFGPGPVQPTFSMGNPLQAPNVSTGGVHPLVRASMLPRIKRAKQTSLAARSKAMATPPVSKPKLSVNELRSRRSEVGRMPRG
jgi:hypothetical protein